MTASISHSASVSGIAPISHISETAATHALTAADDVQRRLMKRCARSPETGDDLWLEKEGKRVTTSVTALVDADVDRVTRHTTSMTSLCWSWQCSKRLERAKMVQALGVRRIVARVPLYSLELTLFSRRFFMQKGEEPGTRAGKVGQE